MFLIGCQQGQFLTGFPVRVKGYLVEYDDRAVGDKSH